MAKYLFATIDTGSIVNAKDLVGQKTTDTYTCLGCGTELIAKVNGAIMQPHFAHKSSQECSGETYLHKLGKQVFFETYSNCLNNNLPFLIELTFSKKCRKFKNIIFNNCELGFITKTFNLTEYYQEILVEKKDDKFIPDILLKSKRYPNDNIYIEIAVTHFLSHEKQDSDNRIIEIPLESEEDILKIQNANLSNEDALFLGFNQKSQAISDQECKCAHKQYLIFYVYKSGKSFLDSNTLSSISYALKNKPIIYFNLIQENEDHELTYAQGDIFIREVERAFKKKIKMKNCFLCKYHGNNSNYWDNEPIFCKAKRITCNSNYATECDWFNPPSPQ